MYKSKSYFTYLFIILILIIYNIISIVSLYGVRDLNSAFGKNAEMIMSKSLRISPYKFSEVSKLHQKSFIFVSNIARRKNKSITLALDASRGRNLLNRKIWNYRNSRIFFDISRSRGKYSYLDINYWNYYITYMINNRIFNRDFNGAFFNAVYLSRYNKQLFNSYKIFYFKNLPKFSNEAKTKLNQLLFN